MTLDQFVDYQLTVSHCVAAVDRGRPRADVREWLVDSLEPVFDGTPHLIRFFGAFTCLRPLA